MKSFLGCKAENSYILPPHLRWKLHYFLSSLLMHSIFKKLLLFSILL